MRRELLAVSHLDASLSHAPSEGMGRPPRRALSDVRRRVQSPDTVHRWRL